MHIFPKCSKTLDKYEIPVLASELTATTLPCNVSLRLLLILRFKKKLNGGGGGGGGGCVPIICRKIDVTKS